MTTQHPLSEEIAAVARELRSEVGSPDTMDKAVKLSLEVVRGAQEVAISLVHRDGPIDTPAATGTAARRVDELQYEHGEGPCLDAIRRQETVYSPDIGADDRWPAWGPAAAEQTGVRSMMCFQLFTNEDTMGALNMYSRQIDAFSDSDREHGLAIAAQAAIAVAAAKEIEQLKLGMDSRNIIGQAQGILMATYKLDAQAAFAVLTRLSSHSNRKLRDVAIEVAALRDVPGL